MFREYKQLILQYWGALPRDDRSQWVRDEAKRPESKESLELRQKINLRFPEANDYAHRLGVGVTWQSFPPPAVGGAVIPVNILMSVIDPEMGHGHIKREQILDVIHRAIGTAQTVKRRAFWGIVNPIMWPIQIAAFVVRIPFLILRRAGLPDSVEENIISQVVKAVLMVILLLLAAYLGLEKYIGNLLSALGK